MTALAAPPMTDDPDVIGPDGTVRLRCYLPSANSVWFSAGCGHSAPIGIRAAIRLMGPEATVRQLERRLRCSRCGGRQVSIVLQPDTRPPAVRESEGRGRKRGPGSPNRQKEAGNPPVKRVPASS